MKLPCVYILASQKNGTLYTGVTSDLVPRIFEHKSEYNEGFTKKHNIKILVWYEVHEIIESAILREKRIKKWSRQWKIEMIQKDNPNWIDLYPTIL